MKLKRLVFLLLAVPACAAAQTADRRRPEFAVSSVKPSNSLGRPEVGNFNGRGYAKDATLKMIMATAYQVPLFRISGGPGWAGSERFDVEGKAEDPKTGYLQLRLMMQSLLEDRFHLRVHRETSVSSVYFLVTAKGGAKMNLSADQTSPDASSPSSSPADGPPRGSVMMGAGGPDATANAADLPGLFTALREQLGLELKAGRGPVEILVIDSAEKPSPN